MVIGCKQYDGHKFDVKGGHKDRPAKLVVELGSTITVQAKLEKQFCEESDVGCAHVACYCSA